MPIHTTHTRDAALRELHKLNRWMIAGSVVLTGLLTDVAANAFPGRTIKHATKSKAARANSSHTKAGSSGGTSTGVGPLAPPEHAPNAAGESTSSQESAPARESAPAQESAPAEEPAPAQEAAPAQETAPQPAQETAPVQEAAPEPAQEPAPVVSGGS